MKSTRSAALRAKPISWVTTIIVMPSLGEADHDVEHLGDHLGVERGGRLVEQHQLRLHRERPGDRDALLLAAGELRRHLLRLVGDTRPARAAPSPAPRRPCCDILRTRIGPRVTFSSTVLCANRLNDWKTMPTSARSLASPRALVGQHLAVDRDRAGVDRLEPVDRAAEGRLARAARPDDDDDLALCTLVVDVLQHVEFAEVLVDVVDDDERFTAPSPDARRHGRVFGRLHTPKLGLRAPERATSS